MAIRRLLAATATGLALTAMSLAAPQVAQAANCQVNVNSSMTLTADAPNCVYNVAAGVTLDLGDHLVGAVAFDTGTSTGSATVRNGDIDVTGLSDPTVPAVALSGSAKFNIRGLRILHGSIVGHAPGGTAITQNQLRDGGIDVSGDLVNFGTTHSILSNVLTGGGVELVNANGVVRGNVLHGNNGSGVGMTIVGDVKVTGNSVTGHFVGLSARIGPNANLALNSNLIVGNVSSGIVLTHIVGQAEVADNLVAFNGYGVAPGTFPGAGDGIYVNVSGGTVTVTSNDAYGNAWIGINGLSGVVDGGGNRASENGGPAQCVGVTCGTIPGSSAPSP